MRTANRFMRTSNHFTHTSNRFTRTSNRFTHGNVFNCVHTHRDVTSLIIELMPEIEEEDIGWGPKNPCYCSQ